MIGHDTDEYMHYSTNMRIAQQKLHMAGVQICPGLIDIAPACVILMVQRR